VSKAIVSAPWQRALIVLTTTVVAALAVGTLYWAQVVLIPLALAVFLTFLLSAPVLALQRRGLGRVSSVLVVVIIACLLLSGVCWVVGVQMSNMVGELPKHAKIIVQKVQSVRDAADKWMSRGGGLWQEVSGELKPRVPEADENAPPDEGKIPPAVKPLRVVVEPDSTAWLSRLPHVGSVLEPLGAAVLTVVLAIFMLLKREDLRNRFISLAGHGRMTVTTKAVDDAGSRISRFLFMQVIINAGYGLVWGIGLRLIGVDYALLWGFIAALARYVPYVGTPLASLMPIALSTIMYEGWTHVILVVVLLIVMELVTANAIEPLLFGQSIGVSEVALLLAAAFWAFLWGPIGLVLSGPLTVCLVVLGRYVPQLEFFSVLLGDEPALEPHVASYQRLLARDQDEAEGLVRTHAKTAPAEQVFDDLLVPSLNYVKRDHERDLLSDEDDQFVLRVTREIIEDLGERQARVDATAGGARAKTPAAERVLVMGFPARDQADGLALEMLAHTLDPNRWVMEILSNDMLVSQMVELAEEKKPAIFCIASLPPGGMAHTRYLCKRLRGQLPDLKIVVGRWGQKSGADEIEGILHEAGADLVATTLLETRDQMTAWLPVLVHEKQATAGGAAAKR
jgi:predicted PurR-regulated permease PerM